MVHGVPRPEPRCDVPDCPHIWIIWANFYPRHCSEVFFVGRPTKSLGTYVKPHLWSMFSHLLPQLNCHQPQIDQCIAPRVGLINQVGYVNPSPTRMWKKGSTWDLNHQVLRVDADDLQSSGQAINISSKLDQFSFLNYSLKISKKRKASEWVFMKFIH